MIDELQVVPKAQVLENNTMGRNLALALQLVQLDPEEIKTQILERLKL